MLSVETGIAPRELAENTHPDLLDAMIQYQADKAEDAQRDAKASRLKGKMAKARGR